MPRGDSPLLGRVQDGRCGPQRGRRGGGSPPALCQALPGRGCGVGGQPRLCFLPWVAVVWPHTMGWPRTVADAGTYPGGSGALLASGFFGSGCGGGRRREGGLSLALRKPSTDAGGPTEPDPCSRGICTAREKCTGGAETQGRAPQMGVSELSGTPPGQLWRWVCSARRTGVVWAAQDGHSLPLAFPGQRSRGAAPSRGADPCRPPRVPSPSRCPAVPAAVLCRGQPPALLCCAGPPAVRGWCRCSALPGCPPAKSLCDKRDRAQRVPGMCRGQ